MNIKAIIFDLGRVLIDVHFNRGLFPLLAPEDDSSNDTLSARIEALFRNPLFRLFNSGQLTPHEFYFEMIRQYRLNLSFQDFKQKWCDIFTEIDGMDLLLNELKDRFALGLLSDTDPLHWNYCIQRFSFLKLIPRPTLSFRTGKLKPHPLAYEIAARDVGFSVEECLFIDDRVVNVEGAKKIGMPSLLFNNPQQLKEEFAKIGLF